MILATILALSATAGGLRAMAPQDACLPPDHWGTGAATAGGDSNFVSFRAGKPTWNGEPVTEAKLRENIRATSTVSPPALTLYRRGASCADLRRVAAAIEAERRCKPGICIVSDAEPPEAKRSRALQAVNPGSWVTNEDYPASALRAGEQGTAFFTLDVDEKGVVTGCVVTRSAQSPWLDDATCRLLKARAHFVPALDASGTPIAAQYSNRFRWEIPPRPSASLASWTVELRYVIGPGGEVLSYHATAYGPSSEDMKQACPWIGGRPREALEKLRGSSAGRVTIVLRSEHAVAGMPVPPVPALPAAFKRASVQRFRLEIGPDGIPTACYRDLGQGETVAPAANCRLMAKYVASDAAHTVRGTSTVFTDGDPDIADALMAL